MKKLFTLLLLAISLQAVAQQNIYIWQNGEFDKKVVNVTDEMTYSLNGTRLTLGGTVYNTALIDSITFTAPTLDLSNKVLVQYNGNSATVTVPENVSGVTYTVKGAHVTLNSTNITDELEYVLQGNSSNGSLTYNGNFKCKLYLNGLDLTSAQDGAINIQCGKRIDLILFEGTNNRLTDAAGGQQKAAFYCKGHVEVKGGGTLTVAGKTKHAISTNEYLIVKKSVGKIVVTEAVSDGIHAGQYFQMNGGTVDISGVQGDGIQAEITKDPLDEFNGYMMIQGGKINLQIPGKDVKGLKCDNEMLISGGEIYIDVTGDGSKGIGCSYTMTVSEDDGPTDITVLAKGGVYNYINTAGQPDSSKCMGIKVSFDLVVEGGRILVKNTGASSKGIKVDGVYYHRGGTVDALIDAVAIGK